uniref:Uncharacterized protein n=1 Tax=Roseihalotalea indica TaxID=2867963 RepID=A0AA49GLH3_9BACT|nr:hypothetical protein K4G66_32095 [Tunicatimonas sp. TK19036]
MRQTLLTFSILFMACCSAWSQDISLNVTVEHLTSQQPYALAETYYRVLPGSALSHSIYEESVSGQELQEYKPEKLDNAWALRYWQVMQDIRTVVLPEGAFLRKHLPIHQDSTPIISVDKEFAQRLKDDLKVVY